MQQVRLPTDADVRRARIDALKAQYDKLHTIEQAIVDHLSLRDVDEWCLGCDMMLDRLWEKVHGTTIHQRN